MGCVTGKAHHWRALIDKRGQKEDDPIRGNLIFL
jgi:hypothetical protein